MVLDYDGRLPTNQQTDKEIIIEVRKGSGKVLITLSYV